MPAGALAPKVANASAGMVLAVEDRQHVLLSCNESYLIHVTSQKVNMSLLIFQTIHYAKS